MFKKPQGSNSIVNTSYDSNITMTTNKTAPTKKIPPFTNEANPFVHHNRSNLNHSNPIPAPQAAKLPPINPPKKKNAIEEDTISKATSQTTLRPINPNYSRSYSNHSLLSGATVRTERSMKIFNTEMLKPKPKPPPEKFTADANPFVNSSRNQLNSAVSKSSLNESKKMDISKQSQDHVVEKISHWQVKNKEEMGKHDLSIEKAKTPTMPHYSELDAPFVVTAPPSHLNMSYSTVMSQAPRDASKSSIGFMLASPEPFQNRISAYFKNKVTRFNVLIFFLFLVVLVMMLVALVAPYWLVMKEPWIERLLIPKQFIIDPEKTNAWIGLYSSCNTENRCASGTPYDTRGWYNTCKVLFALGFALMCVAVVVECMYLCCIAYVLVPSFKLVLFASLCIFAAAILWAVAVALYGASCLSDGLLTPMSLNGPGGLLAWGYFLAIVSTAFAFLLALLFSIDSLVQSKKLKASEDTDA